MRHLSSCNIFRSHHRDLFDGSLFYSLSYKHNISLYLTHTHTWPLTFALPHHPSELRHTTAAKQRIRLRTCRNSSPSARPLDVKCPCHFTVVSSQSHRGEDTARYVISGQPTTLQGHIWRVQDKRDRLIYGPVHRNCSYGRHLDSLHQFVKHLLFPVYPFVFRGSWIHYC